MRRPVLRSLAVLALACRRNGTSQCSSQQQHLLLDTIANSVAQLDTYIHAPKAFSRAQLNCPPLPRNFYAAPLHFLAMRSP